ncbi:MAG: NADP(H)-dependent aldo-keto reductase [Gammaproteobacteria bacterium]|nr:NADP(H)-dependent aldo-keto reductase [Gammaproteobacteria bacterium]
MKYNLLGNTAIKVSQVCLGSMTWGEQNTEAEAFRQLDYAFGRGVNFIDTAEIYPIPPKPETRGLTETYIGNWLKRRRCRDKTVLATKAAGPGDIANDLRGGPRLNRKHIREAIAASLRRLQTDYIDLYQLHWPDRNTNFFGKLNYTHDVEEEYTPIRETLTVLADLVNEGKIRHIGVSNETPWGVMTFLKYAEQDSLPRLVSIQNPYSFLNRGFETGLAEITCREQVSLLAYSPLAFGVLSGKYINNVRPARARLTLFDRYTRYSNEPGVKATQAYVHLAEQQGMNAAEMALAYVGSRPFVTSCIIGAVNMDQLKADIPGVTQKLPEETLIAIEAIHEKYPNPCP